VSEYSATIIRDGAAWIVEVPDVDAVAPAANLADARRAVRQLVAGSSGAHPDVVAAEVEVFVPGVSWLSQRIARVGELRKHAAALEAEATAGQRQLVRELTHSGVSLHDAAELLGISLETARQFQDE